MSRKYLLAYVAIMCVLTMSFRCEKGVAAPDWNQTFEVPVDISPLKKSYSLTDTIWLETDITGKTLLDTKTGTAAVADTGNITFRLNYNPFGSSLKNPSDGFCDVITTNGVNTNRMLATWSTVGAIEHYGCGLPSYRVKIGFKPNHKGNYYLMLQNLSLLESCPNKRVPYVASVAYRYKTADLNLDVLNNVSTNDKGGKSGQSFYEDKINKREVFVFKVQ